MVSALQTDVDTQWPQVKSDRHHSTRTAASADAAASQAADRNSSSVT
jgi:hypothetical protein